MANFNLLTLLFVCSPVITRCYSLYWRYRPEVTLTVGSFETSIVGNYAGYSSYETQITNSDLALIPENAFGCSSASLSDSNVTETLTTVSRPFVIMMPLSSAECSDYQKTYTATGLGAAGVVFYYFSTSESRDKKLTDSSGMRKLSIPVAAIKIAESTLTSIQEQISRLYNNTSQVSIIGKHYQSLQTSQTFYFVVFSFCILTLLSCLWFMLSYIRKCRTRAQRRQRRVQAERETRRLVDNLPVKTFKSSKGSEEPTCAICLEMFHNKDTIRVLPCEHEFHKKCIDPWLKLKRTCPMCKEDISTNQAAAKPHSERRAAHTNSISSDDPSNVQLLSDTHSDLSSLDSTSGERASDEVVHATNRLLLEELENGGNNEQDESHAVIVLEEPEVSGDNEEGHVATATQSLSTPA